MQGGIKQAEICLGGHIVKKTDNYCILPACRTESEISKKLFRMIQNGMKEDIHKTVLIILSNISFAS